MRLFLLGRRQAAYIILLVLGLSLGLWGSYFKNTTATIKPSEQVTANLPDLSLSADAAVVMEASTGQLLYAKNPYKLRPPASTTKILTAVIGIERGKMSDPVVVSRNAASTVESTIYLYAGETVTMQELLYGALMESGNDACVAIAEHVGGAEELFVWLMNKKASLLGAKRSVFKNTNGLPDPQHLSTAYDLALLARYALHNKTFAKIVSTQSISLDAPGQKSPRTFSNTNRLLYSYPGADGVKTGTTDAAGQCLVASATRNGRQIIAVVLGSESRYRDTKLLMEHAFNNFKVENYYKKGDFVTFLNVTGGTDSKVRVVSGYDLDLWLPSGKPGKLDYIVNLNKGLTAPVRKGQALGSMDFYVNGFPAGQSLLVAGEELPQAGLWKRMLKIVEKITFFHG